MFFGSSTFRTLVQGEISYRIRVNHSVSEFFFYFHFQSISCFIKAWFGGNADLLIALYHIFIERSVRMFVSVCYGLIYLQFLLLKTRALTKRSRLHRKNLWRDVFDFKGWPCAWFLYSQDQCALCECRVLHLRRTALTTTHKRDAQNYESIGGCIVAGILCCCSWCNARNRCRLILAVLSLDESWSPTNTFCVPKCCYQSVHCCCIRCFMSGYALLHASRTVANYIGAK
jgi:hypothetical protein